MVEYAQHREQSDAREEPAAPAWRFVETIAGALVTPGRTLRHVAQQEAIIPAVFLVLIVAGLTVSGQVASLIAGLGQTAPQDDPFGGTAGAFAGLQMMNILWTVVWGPVLWTITAALLFGIGYLLGGRGRFVGLWAASGFALAPQLLAAPLAPMMEAAGVLGTGWQLLVLLFAIPTYIITFIWTLALLAIAVRESMNLSGGRSFAAVAILVGGFVLLMVLLVCMFLLLIVGLVAAIS